VIPGQPIRVLLADDQALVRTGFRVLLDVEDDINVVAEASDGAEAVRQAVAGRPDVVLMDIRMPTMDGIEATRRIVATPNMESVRVLILTTFDTENYVYEALLAGASGFLLKDCGPDELLHGIRVVAAGDALLAPKITRRLITEFATVRRGHQAASERLETLTRREREIMTLVGRGLSNTEIGDALSLSPATVRTHVSRTLTKLRARDRAQLVVMAYEAGLVGAQGDR